MPETVQPDKAARPTPLLQTNTQPASLVPATSSAQCVPIKGLLLDQILEQSAGYDRRGQVAGDADHAAEAGPQQAGPLARHNAPDVRIAQRCHRCFLGTVHMRSRWCAGVRAGLWCADAGEPRPMCAAPARPGGAKQGADNSIAQQSRASRLRWRQKVPVPTRLRGAADREAVQTGRHNGRQLFAHPQAMRAPPSSCILAVQSEHANTCNMQYDLNVVCLFIMHHCRGTGQCAVEFGLERQLCRMPVFCRRRVKQTT